VAQHPVDDFADAVVGESPVEEFDEFGCAVVADPMAGGVGRGRRSGVARFGRGAAVAGVDRGRPQRQQQMAFAPAGSDGERLQHLRSVLPCRVRVTAWTHPLFGELLACSGFRRWNGALLLVVNLPDGSPGTIRADATDVFATETTASMGRSAAIGDEGK
jgi:hypothetical protein